MSIGSHTPITIITNDSWTRIITAWEASSEEKQKWRQKKMNSNIDLDELEKCCVSGLSSVVRNKKIVLIGPPTRSRMMISAFKKSGAADVISISLDSSYYSEISEYNNNFSQELRKPSQLLLKRINEIDPVREALVYAGSSIDVEWLDRRKIIGSRCRAWANLERKEVQTKILSVQHGYKSCFVFLDSMNMNRFIDLCREHYPCVISGELIKGIEMGTSKVFIINESTKEAISYVYQELKQSCSGFRIANYMNGMPITVYGFCSDDIFCYPPVIGIVGYRNLDGKVTAPGIIALKNLNIDLERVREEVQDLIQKVTNKCGFCGAFGVDGVFNKGHYIIHDLNPRICAGFVFVSKYFGGKVPQNVVDIILREHATQANELMSMLCGAAKNMEYDDEVMIWKDKELSVQMTKDIQRDGFNQQFLKRVLGENEPLFDPCPEEVSYYDYQE